MLQDERKRHQMILARERRTRDVLFGIAIHADSRGDAYTNEMILNGYFDQVDDGKPAVFGTWRPLEKPERPYGSRMKPPERRRQRYVPVVSPLLGACVDAALLTERAVRWTWRALDGSR